MVAVVTFFDPGAPDMHVSGDLKLALVAAAILAGALALTLAARPVIRRIVASDAPETLINLALTATLDAPAVERAVRRFMLRHKRMIQAIFLDFVILAVVLVNVIFVIFLRSLRCYYLTEHGFPMHTMPSDVSKYEAFIDVFVAFVIAHRLFRIGAPLLRGLPR